MGSIRGRNTCSSSAITTIRIVRVVAVCHRPAMRYARLSQRPVRPLTLKEAYSRDETEITHLNKAGAIAMADYTIVNEGSLKDLEKETKKIISSMEKQP